MYLYNSNSDLATGHRPDRGRRHQQPLRAEAGGGPPAADQAWAATRTTSGSTPTAPRGTRPRSRRASSSTPRTRPRPSDLEHLRPGGQRLAPGRDGRGGRPGPGQAHAPDRRGRVRRRDADGAVPPTAGCTSTTSPATCEAAPVKLGYWNFDDVRATEDQRGCTAHVFQVFRDQAIMLIANYNGGVHVLDVAALAGLGAGSASTGITELGRARFANSNTWAVKSPRFDRDGLVPVRERPGAGPRRLPVRRDQVGANISTMRVPTVSVGTMHHHRNIAARMGPGVRPIASARSSAGSPSSCCPRSSAAPSA